MVFLVAHELGDMLLNRAQCTPVALAGLLLRGLALNLIRGGPWMGPTLRPAWQMTALTPIPSPQMQRSRGEAAVRLRQDGGRIRLVDLRQQGSAKAILPRVAGVPEVVFLNTSGGLTGGDRLSYAVALGDGVSIGANCVIRDAKIDRGVTIKAFSHIDGATIGADAQIGPYARLRPGTELGADVHVGNFVEIKNSQFDAHSKANHLAYVGDATVGARVNIGAGTITCNYDGANKHRTIIEDDAFIGSDTQLVAPVTVGKGATLGAGTTLTKDAPPDSLTVSRAKQISITGWQRPVKTKK